MKILGMQEKKSFNQPKSCLQQTTASHSRLLHHKNFYTKLEETIVNIRQQIIFKILKIIWLTAMFTISSKKTCFFTRKVDIRDKT
jgi:hypothetical protein